MAAASETTTATNYIRFVDCCNGTEIKFKGASSLIDGQTYSYEGVSSFPGFGGSLIPGRCYTANLEYTAVSPIPYPNAPSNVEFSGKASCLDPKCGQCPKPGCECPEGYTLVDGECTKTTYTQATYTGGTITLITGAKNCGYGCGGALLYEDITAKPKPILGTGTLPTNYTVKDNNGAGADVTAWNSNTPSTYITWSFTNPGIVNTLWGSSQGQGASCSSSPISAQPCPTGATDGRLNKVGVWAPGFTYNEELSFEYCITIDSTKQYLVALAGDNYVRFYVDGNPYVKLEDSTGGARTPFNYWHIFPITLTAGTHVIKICGLDVGGVATVGGEIYDITESQFRATLGVKATGPGNCGNVIADLEPYIVFSTKDLIGLDVSDPDNPGTWSCPDGSTVDTCNGTVQCKTEEAFKLACECYMLIPCDGSDPILTNNVDFADRVGEFVTVSTDTYDGCVYVAELIDNDCNGLESANIIDEIPCSCTLNCYYVEGTDGFLYVDENNVLQEVSAIAATPYAKVCSKVYPVPTNTSQNYTIIGLGQCDANGCPISCYKLTNCDDPADIIYTNSDSIIPYVFGTNNIVRILNRTGCYTASLLDEGEVCDCPITVTVTASFSSCVACTGYKAYKLTACETGDVIYTTDDLEIYVDKTVQTDCGCYLVKRINFLPPSPQPVTVEYVFDNCDKCLATYYLLRNCATNEVEVYTLTDLSLEVGKVIKIEGCDACLSVEETREPGITRNVVITDRYNLCEECIKANQKCKCQSAVNGNLEASVKLRYIDCNGLQADTSFVASGKRSGKYCVLEWVTGVDIIDHGDCNNVTTTTCHTYIITVPPFPDNDGGALFYKDCQGNEVSQLFPKSKSPVTVVKCGVDGQTAQDIYIVGFTTGSVIWLETTNPCEQEFDCPPPTYPTRPVIPGYNTPGCDVEKFEKITCQSSEILYKTVMQKRYGISNCCPDEDDKWLIKKELMDLQAAVDPNYTCEPVQSCCTGTSSCNCGCNNQLKTCNS